MEKKLLKRLFQTENGASAGIFKLPSSWHFAVVLPREKNVTSGVIFGFRFGQFWPLWTLWCLLDGVSWTTSTQATSEQSCKYSEPIECESAVLFHLWDPSCKQHEIIITCNTEVAFYSDFEFCLFKFVIFRVFCSFECFSAYDLLSNF